ncbi:hypothetical protein Ancab_012340 [Ancistrocladus abbreviatus]
MSIYGDGLLGEGGAIQYNAEERYTTLLEVVAFTNGLKMGSGHFAQEVYGKASFVCRLQYINISGTYVTPKQTMSQQFLHRSATITNFNWIPSEVNGGVGKFRGACVFKSKAEYCSYAAAVKKNIEDGGKKSSRSNDQQFIAGFPHPKRKGVRNNSHLSFYANSGNLQWLQRCFVGEVHMVEMVQRIAGVFRSRDSKTLSISAYWGENDFIKECLKIKIADDSFQINVFEESSGDAPYSWLVIEESRSVKKKKIEESRSRSTEASAMVDMLNLNGGTPDHQEDKQLVDSGVSPQKEDFHDYSTNAADKTPLPAGNHNDS